MSRIALLFLLLIGAAPEAEASSEQSCRASTSPRVAIETVQADVHRWFGRCVRLVGIIHGNRLLADREAALEAAQARDEDIRRSLVIYSVEGLVLDRPVRAEIVGQIGSCAAHHEVVGQMREEHPDEIIMVSGYCHTSLETYIRPAAIRRLSRRPIPRLTEAEVPVERRQLVEAPPGSARSAELVAVARALVAAIATADEAAYFRLTDPSAALEQERLSGAPLPEWIAERRLEARQRLRRLRSLGSPFRSPKLLTSHAQRVLIERLALDDDLSRHGPGRLTICWCRTADCAGRWPVLASDADARPDRPYACVDASRYIVHGRPVPVIQATVRETDGELAEPIWPDDGAIRNRAIDGPQPQTGS